MKILLAIFTIVAGWFLVTKQALGFTNSDINTASFTEVNVIPEYEDPGTRQWGQRIANNTAANNRLSGRDMVIDNEAFAASQEKTYDTDRDYRNSYIYIRMKFGPASSPLPVFIILGSVDEDQGWTFETTTKITSTESDLMRDVAPMWKIKAPNSGGFTLINQSAVNSWYVSAVVTELRLITGV